MKFSKIEIASDTILNIYQKRDEVLKTFNSNKYVIFKETANSDSINEIM